MAMVSSQVSTEGKAAERAVVVCDAQAQLGRREAALAGAAMLIAAAPVGQVHPQPQPSIQRRLTV